MRDRDRTTPPAAGSTASVDPATTRLKLRPGQPAEAHDHGPAARPERDDLAEYLATLDARDAEFWQLEALARARQSIGRPLTVATYERLRRLFIGWAADAAAAAGKATGGQRG